MKSKELRAFDAGFSLARVCSALKLDMDAQNAADIIQHANACMTGIGYPFAFAIPEGEAERRDYLSEHFGTETSTIYRFQDHVSSQMGKKALAAFEIGFLLSGVSFPPGPEANTIRRHLTRLNVSEDVVDMFDNLKPESFWGFLARLRDRIDRATRIFLSYRRADGSGYARLVWFYLTSLGHDVFLDVETLKAHKYGPEIVAAIEECHVFMPILTPTYFDRVSETDDWVRQEIEQALELKKHILPIQIGEHPQRTASPSSIEGELMQYSVCHLYHVDFHGFAARLKTQLEDCRAER